MDTQKLSIRKWKSEPDLQESQLCGQSFAALCKLATDAALQITSASSNAAPPITSQKAEAIEELGERMSRYEDCEKTDRMVRDYSKLENIDDEPIGSLASYVVTIRIEVEPETIKKDERTFSVIGDLSSRTYGEQLLTSHVSKIKIPKGSKLELVAFDTLVEAVASYMPNLIETEESIAMRDAVRDALKNANYEYVKREPDILEDDETAASSEDENTAEV